MTHPVYSIRKVILNQQQNQTSKIATTFSFLFFKVSLSKNKLMIVSSALKSYYDIQLSCLKLHFSSNFVNLIMLIKTNLLA